MARIKRDDITDALSPDFSTCVHCGQPIGWDDYSYTHMHTGFSTCGTIVGGGTQPTGIFAKVARATKISFVVNPEVLQDPDVNTNAEPVEWYRDGEERESLGN